MKRIMMVSLFLITLSGCPRPHCEVGQVRCNGEVAEICDSARQWSFRVDCAFVNDNSPKQWGCQYGTCIVLGEVP